jgi:hypothetical protein
MALINPVAGFVFRSGVSLLLNTTALCPHTCIFVERGGGGAKANAQPHRIVYKPDALSHMGCFTQ